MKCPYCNKNTISPVKKFLNENIQCNSCGESIHFSDSKRKLIMLLVLTALYFNSILSNNSIYKYMIFLGLVIALFFLFMIIPVERENK